MSAPNNSLTGPTQQLTVTKEGILFLCFAMPIHQPDFFFVPVGIVITSEEPVCPRVELILKIIIILVIIFLGFIKSKPC